MENKFTFEHSHSFDKKVVLNNGSYHADFREEKDAQDYVAWKNQNGIDKTVKEEIKIFLKDRLDNFTVKINEAYKVNLYEQNYINAIEIIKNLREEE